MVIATYHELDTRGHCNDCSDRGYSDDQGDHDYYDDHEAYERLLVLWEEYWLMC